MRESFLISYLLFREFFGQVSSGWELGAWRGRPQRFKRKLGIWPWSRVFGFRISGLGLRRAPWSMASKEGGGLLYGVLKGGRFIRYLRNLKEAEGPLRSGE